MQNFWKGVFTKVATVYSLNKSAGLENTAQYAKHTVKCGACAIYGGVGPQGILAFRD